MGIAALWPHPTVPLNGREEAPEIHILKSPANPEQYGLHFLKNYPSTLKNWNFLAVEKIGFGGGRWGPGILNHRTWHAELLEAKSGSGKL